MVPIGRGFAETPINWQAKPAAANGVYLLTYAETGEQYVGAAFGIDGFLGRRGRIDVTGRYAPRSRP